MREATLVGHSMGAIVLNRAVSYFPELRADRLVYLAPACSVNDFALLAGPYLRSHPRTQFYNITLHPFAEKRERSVADSLIYGELLPRGSLLVWIDDFLQHPRSFPDRTFGQFENAMLASLLFHPRIQGQIHICALGAQPAENVPLGTWARRVFFTQYAGPTHHGDFSNYKFWEAEFVTSPGWVDRTPYKIGTPSRNDSSAPPEANPMPAASPAPTPPPARTKSRAAATAEPAQGRRIPF